MNKLRLAAAFGLLCVMGLARANDLNASQGAAYPGKWVPSISQYGEWKPTGEAYDCGPWELQPNTFKSDSSFHQSSQCSQNFERQVSLTVINDTTGIKRETGIIQTERKTDTVKLTR